MKVEITSSSKIRGSHFVPGIYTVLAIEMDNKATWYYCFSNPEIPVPDPCDATTVRIVDGSIPNDWVCKQVKYDSMHKIIRLSFKEWTEDTYFYEDAIEDAIDNVRLIQKKLKAYEA